MRNLANKSAEASRNTTVLIESSLRAVENGAVLADETAKTLKRVVEGVGGVADAIDKISEASGEQAHSAEQVSQGIEQISGVVQVNSGTAEESAAASEELSAQAQILKELKVSEIGLGAEWLERHNAREVKEVVLHCEEAGINILDCWMSEPNVRSNIGAAIKGRRQNWIIQGHLGSTWQGGQYVRTRDLAQAKAAFSDLLERLGTDYIDLGMIHFVDEEEEFHRIMDGEFYVYAGELKEKGMIRHIGMSTHNPAVAKLAAVSGKIEIILFSINPAFDMLPASEDMTEYFKESYDEKLGGIAPERAELYRICEKNGVGITVMKGYAGGRLFSADTGAVSALCPDASGSCQCHGGI